MMKSCKSCFRLAPAAFLLLAAVSASAAVKAPTRIPWSKSVGEVVDAAENSRLGLFSRDTGFISARLYAGGTRRNVAHIMGKKDGVAWMLIEPVTKERMAAIGRRLRKAGELERNGLPIAFEQVVYKINLPSWLVRGATTEIELVDGSRLYGTISDCADSVIVFRTLTGITLNMPESQILKVRWPRGKFRDGQFVSSDPSDTRLFFAPTGRTLRAGEALFEDYYVLFPSLSVGVSDFAMIGGGMSLIPGSPRQLFYIAPRVRLLRQKNVDVAAGLMYMGVPGSGGFTTGFAAMTAGDDIGSVTLGAAQPLQHEDDFGWSTPAFFFGGEKRISRRAKFITENWVFTGDDSFVILSAGVRFLGRRMSTDFAMVTSPDAWGDGNFPFLPWLNFTVNFGR